MSERDVEIEALRGRVAALEAERAAVVVRLHELAEAEDRADRHIPDRFDDGCSRGLAMGFRRAADIVARGGR